ncbi:MAG TPA: HlyD family type I secretion periplasmic adaptor subunit [Steroidobacteraceae bacterium]|nr:HlyD family type I secretion periplasmic adaptor subunit [Steroidobacteraceae bacterium]
MSPPATFASMLMRSEDDPQAGVELRRQKRLVVIPLAVTAALLALWMIAAPLSGAIIAAGKLKVELNRKTVQHQEGGIVRSILVRDGELVRAGQPLIVVGDVRSDAQLNMLRDQLRAERIRNARSSAEAVLATKFQLPAGLDDGAGPSDDLARETALFQARRRTLDEQIASLEAQARDARLQAAALTKQIETTAASAKLAAEELEINEKLVRQGYVQRTRLLELQRGESDYRSRLAEAQSDLALAQQRSGELQARIAQARNQYQQVATDETRESAARIRELEERVRPSQDQAERQYVRAPVDGRVMALRVSSVGEVIGPRDALLDIVPTREKLVVEARIRPQDINHVREHSTAEVRLTAFDARTTPLLPGSVVFVSPDRITAQETGESWFVATVEVDAAALREHPSLRLQPGMPAELFVKTPERTLFQYLTKPLDAFATHAMREP